MKYILLILASALVYFFAFKQWKKNTAEMITKNSTEKDAFKRRWNAFYFRIWPGYLYVLATGLIVNNLIFR